MYGRLLESDATYNGRFFTGVLTTGIYCLPACRARKPKPENVKFFPTCEAARAAGLRACRKCRPDDFARGADPVLEDIEKLVGEIRALKMLAILQLLRQGVKQGQIAATLGISEAKMSRMLPTGISKSLLKGGSATISESVE